MELLVVFAVGVIASAIAALIYEYGTGPLLKVSIDESLRAPGQLSGEPPHEFYHLKVTNIKPKWPLPNRKPAWSCKATLEVFHLNGQRAIPEFVTARWPSKPEPLKPEMVDGAFTQLIDPARMVAAQKVDIYSHEDEKFAVTLKFDGSSKCHIFSNESYYFPRWQHPEWRLSQGEYRLRVTLYYKRGREVTDFLLQNKGRNRSDVRLQPWPATRCQ